MGLPCGVVTNKIRNNINYRVFSNVWNINIVVEIFKNKKINHPILSQVKLKFIREII